MPDRDDQPTRRPVRPTPGVPVRFQHPAVELDDTRPSPDEPTKPDLPIHIPRPRTPTQRGLAPPHILSSAPPPPRSTTPNPESGAALKVSVDGSIVAVKKKHLERIWVWVAPLLISGAVSVYGYIKGYAMGLAAAAERVARLEGSVTAMTSAVASAGAATQVAIDGLRSSVNRDGALYDDHDKRMLKLEKEVERLTNQVEAVTPKIVGLPKK